MKLILITGKTGSGKNKLGDLLSKMSGYPHIDIDKICHTCYNDNTIVEKVKSYFGSEIMQNGTVDRKKLGKIVFADKDKLKILNDITYNYVIEQIDKIIEQSKDIVILNYVLLPNTKYWKEDCFKILAQSDDDNLRYEKLVLRDNVSMEYILSRDKNSISYPKDEFDYIFNNDYTDERLQNSVKEILDKIKIGE